MPTPPRRRWFRFRLRTILILMAIAAMPLAWIAKERRESQYDLQIAEEFKTQGFIEIGIGSPYDSLKLRGEGIPQGWWRDLAWRVLGGRVVAVGGSLKDLTPISGLTKLQLLFIDQSRISDLSPLSGLSNLQQLVIANTQVNDVTPLLRLKKLEYFNCQGTPISKEQIEKLKEAMPNCKIEHDPFP
jgi:hypothetical protein